MPEVNWQFELEEYIKQGEPKKAEKSILKVKLPLMKCKSEFKVTTN